MGPDLSARARSTEISTPWLSRGPPTSPVPESLGGHCTEDDELRRERERRTPDALDQHVGTEIADPPGPRSRRARPKQIKPGCVLLPRCTERAGARGPRPRSRPQARPSRRRAGILEAKCSWPTDYLAATASARRARGDRGGGRPATAARRGSGQRRGGRARGCPRLVVDIERHLRLSTPHSGPTAAADLTPAPVVAQPCSMGRGEGLDEVALHRLARRRSSSEGGDEASRTSAWVRGGAYRDSQACSG